MFSKSDFRSRKNNLKPISKQCDSVKKYQQSAVQALYGFFALGGVLSTFVTRPFLGIYHHAINVTIGTNGTSDVPRIVTTKTMAL